MDQQKRLAQANNFLQILPHCKKLGMKIITASDGQLTLELPYNPDISGMDPEGYVHGGILTTMMDTVCGFSIIASLPTPEFCPTLDLRIDHMRRANAKGSIFAWPSVTKSPVVCALHGVTLTKMTLTTLLCTVLLHLCVVARRGVLTGL